MFGAGRPIDCIDQFRTPLWFRIRIQEYRRARYEAHSGSRTAAKSSVCVRRDATRAMKYAKGNAMAASISVTRVAIQTVRKMMVREVSLGGWVWKMAGFD